MAQGKLLSAETREGIRAMYQVDPNKAKIARAFNVSLSTVYSVLGKTDPEKQREQRTERMGAMADKMSTKINELLDNLPIPEGASFQQKAVVLGILTDKFEKLDKRLSEQKQEDMAEAVLLPATVHAMAAAIRNEMRAVGIVLQLGGQESRRVVEEVRQAEAETGQRLIPLEGEIINEIDQLDG